VRNFDSKYLTLLESLKDPKDNPCWKGYKPVGTKKKNGKTVPNCVPKESKKNLTENYFPVKTSFADLPDTAPYGFWVWEKKYVIARYMDDHIKILRELMPEEGRAGDFSIVSKAYNKGLIRVVKEGRIYHFNYTRANKTSIKTAYDIAEFYNMGVQDDMNPPDTGNKLKSSPDNAL
jgi:hypothetical protein